MLSAHRCGAGKDTHLENTRTALTRALDMDVEFVEFDVQRCGDGTFVAYHNDWITIDGRRVPLSELTFEEFSGQADHFLRYDEILDTLKGRKRAHIDFKFVSPPEAYRDPEKTYEVVATRRALEVLGADDIIVTTLEDQSVRVVRDWADSQRIDLLVGLSLGRDLDGMARPRRAAVRACALLPVVRYRRCRANLVVANFRLARKTLALYARLRGLPLLVWTVDEDDELRHWLAPGAAWLVTTNYPDRAARIRETRDT
jgi:glycerophosphoryl diester phosphodiesterase